MTTVTEISPFNSDDRRVWRVGTSDSLITTDTAGPQTKMALHHPRLGVIASRVCDTTDHIEALHLWGLSNVQPAFDFKETE